MAKAGDRTVLRFAVVGQDGRRSSTWRVWTGTSKRPSDDTYIARRHAAQFKASLHKDGYCQHGPTDVPSGQRTGRRWTGGNLRRTEPPIRLTSWMARTGSSS
jgi:hypothetical protein